MIAHLIYVIVVTVALRQIWYDPENDSMGWADSVEYGGNGIACYITEYGYASNPNNPDTNGNGVDDLT